MKYNVEIAGKQLEIELREGEALFEGQRFKAELVKQSGSKLYTLFVESKAVELLIEGCQGQYLIQLLGREYEASVKRAVVKELEQYLKKDERQVERAAGQAVVAHMPGLVVKVEVREGQEVRAGDGLIIIDAMKMENEIKAPCDGLIEKISVRDGQEVEKGQLLCSIKVLKKVNGQEALRH